MLSRIQVDNNNRINTMCRCSVTMLVANLFCFLAQWLGRWTELLLREEPFSMFMESRPPKNFSTTQGRSAGISSTEKSRPSVIHLRLLSSLAPSGAVLSLLLAYLPWSSPLRTVRCGEGTCYTHLSLLSMKAYGPFALSPHLDPSSGYLHGS